jgi:hypothetical protein
MGQTLERARLGIMAVTPLLGDGTPMIETNASREMIRLLYEVPGSRPEDLDELSCEYCFEKKAEIFQVTGNYCLCCWQQETHPDV